MLIAIIVFVVAGFLVLAMIGYRMGPPPAGKPITKRDDRLIQQRAEEASFRKVANPHLRSDRAQVVESMAEAAVDIARRGCEESPNLSPTAALAGAFRKLDRLERDAHDVSLGAIAAQMADYLTSVGVLNPVDPSNPELCSLTPDAVRSDPGIVVEIASVKDLYAWPFDRR